MTRHPKIEALSALVDGELSGTSRARAERHLASCSLCAARHDSLASAAAQVRLLEPVAMTPGEHLSLQQALAASATTGSASRRTPAPRWALAAGFVLVAVAAAGLVIIRKDASPTASMNRAGRTPAPQETTFDFRSGRQVEATVAALPQVRDGLRRYTAGDARAAPPGTAALPAAEPAAPGLAGGSAQAAPPKALPESMPSPPPAPGAADTATAPETGAGMQRQGATGFSAGAGAQCLQGVAATQSDPLVPLLARPARYMGRPAWLLVFAWKPAGSTSPTLDRAQIWMVPPGDCARFAGADLVGRALYRSPP